MRDRFFPLLLTAILLLITTSLAAQNVNFLSGRPIADMSKSEIDLLKATVGEALNDLDDGEMVDWVSNESDSSGSVRVLDTHEDYGTTCRSLELRNTVKGVDGGGRVRLCMADSGAWKFAPLRRG